jgi:hypothetical protein
MCTIRIGAGTDCADTETLPARIASARKVHDRSIAKLYRDQFERLSQFDCRKLELFEVVLIREGLKVGAAAGFVDAGSPNDN